MNLPKVNGSPESLTYQDVVESKTKEEMVAKFEQIVMWVCVNYKKTYADSLKIQMENVGYYAGYYDREVAKNVYEWLGAAHPIFGTRAIDGTLTAMEAFEMGTALAKKSKKLLSKDFLF